MIVPPLPSTTIAHILSARAATQNRTTSDGRVGWVSASNDRSTSDILWSCFSVLLVCTWKCIHFNVPSIKQSEAGWHSWGILHWPERPLLVRWMNKIGFMLLIVIAPEIGVAMAMGQLLSAREGLRDLKMSEVKLKEDDVEVDGVTKRVVTKRAITKTHAFFANMGGFTAKIWILSPLEHDRTPSENFSWDESPSVVKSSKVEEYIYEVRSCDDLNSLLKEFPALQLPSEEDIQDLSKADLFTKVFACVQSSWLVIQSLARVSVGLPITELELATMAFVVCALIMYMLWWDKPFGVDRRTILTAITYDLGVKQKLESIHLHQRREYYIEDLSIQRLVTMALGDVPGIGREDLMNIIYAFGSMVKKLFRRSNSVYPPQHSTKSITFYATGTIFSAFHLGAWNWDFPSSTIRTLWRTFGVTATGVGPFAAFLVFRYVFTDRPTGDVTNRFLTVLFLLLSLIYIISRLGLLVLIFYCFSSMPARIYETVAWTKLLPHFS